MPSEDEYRYCARTGMTQAECARHLGISRVSVLKAKRRLGLVFGPGMNAARGKQWEMVFYRYPWEDMAVGDWVEAPAAGKESAKVIASRAGRRHYPKQFRSFMRGAYPVIWRAA